MERAVLFLTSPDDALPREFAAESTDYGLAFPFNLRSECDWCIAWVCDGDGQMQAWLEHMRCGPEYSYFLGSDPAQAMRRAVRIIAKWELPTGKPN